LETPAWIKVTLNGQVVTKGEFKTGDLNLTGTGSHGNPVNYPARVTGDIFLQSHWGSQVEFRNPDISMKGTVVRS
jgi:hypothetical protein